MVSRRWGENNGNCEFQWFFRRSSTDRSTSRRMEHRRPGPSVSRECPGTVVTLPSDVSEICDCRGFEQSETRFFLRAPHGLLPGSRGRRVIQKSAGCRRVPASLPFVQLLQTQLHYLVHALHKSIQILSLSMASPQRGHGSNVVALLVPFDEHCERACTFHMPILSFEKQLDGETGWSGYITRHGVTFSPRCTRARSP
jgi:hypothetical protein